MKTMLLEVSENGERIELMNGTSWEVNPGDIPTSITWSPTANIEVKSINSDNLYTHRLRNLDEETHIYARELN